MEYIHVTHEIKPVFDENSKILILGTLPSPKSRENMFFYGHPQNRFWCVMAEVLGERLPESREEKAAMLKKHGVALWDTISECDILGAADSSIKNAVPTDLSRIFNTADIKMIFTTGRTAYKYYCRYQRDKTGMDAVCLPSTSPANARWTKDMLVNEYSIIKKYL